MKRWSVHWVDDHPIDFSIPQDAFCSVDYFLERELECGIRHLSPFMADPNLVIDARLTGYFNSHKFRRLAPATKKSYLADYRVFFDFLWMRDKIWDQVTSDDIEDFEDWRRRAPDNPRKIGGSKWMRELAALNVLYKWAFQKGHLDVSPLLTQIVMLRTGQSVEKLDVSARDVRSSNVKWVTPRAFHVWRDIGILGYGSDGLPDEGWRGRNGDRNAAFTDLLFDSGLRLTEGATLFTLELPVLEYGRKNQWSMLAAAVSKSRRTRSFTMRTSTLQEIHTYIATTRRSAIRRAQSGGRYDGVIGKRVVLSVGTPPNRTITWADENGIENTARLDSLPAAERQKFYLETDGALEPLCLWLSEAGMPFESHSWENVYNAANKRLRDIRGDSAIFFTPHMARHSFALYMLVVVMHAMDKRYGLTPEERRDFRLLYGDPWRIVQVLLGHASVETTRNIYLAPVEDVQIRTLLEGAEDNGAEFLAALAEVSNRVQDIVE